MALAKTRFEALDGMRGFAAVAVLLFHVSQTSAPWLFMHGYLAVDFFFMLSGFVIGFAYESRLAAGMNVATFMRARIVRLYPLIMAGALIGAAGFSQVYPHLTLGIILLTGIILLPTPYAPKSENLTAMPANPPSWSLFFEVAVNLIYGAIAARLSNRILGLVVTVSAVGLLVAIHASGGANFGSSWPDFYLGTFRVAFPFFAGVALCRIWKAKLIEVIRAPFPVLLTVLGLVLMLPVTARFNVAIDALAIVVVFPALVAAGANADLTQPLLIVCRIAGELSYPLYILQGGLAPHLRDLPSHLGLSGVTAVACIIGICTAYGLFAWAVLKGYDEPVRRSLTTTRKDVVFTPPAQSAP